MAKRRRTRYTWLPNTGTTGPTADPDDTTNGRDFGQVVVAANATTVTTIIDLLTDDASEDTFQTPIGVFLTSEYFVKRIVGKLFIDMAQSATDDTGALLIGAGIFVARADDLDTTAGTPLPIGATTAASATDNYSPLRQETIREPWIWRRTWILSNQASTGLGAVNKYPISNTNYGSVLDGPHIDAKTARRVGQDDRLWMSISARNYPLNAVSASAMSFRAYVDYRVLGAARRAHNRSAF